MAKLIACLGIPLDEDQTGQPPAPAAGRGPHGQSVGGPVRRSRLEEDEQVNPRWLREYRAED